MSPPPPSRQAAPPGRPAARKRPTVAVRRHEVDPGVVSRIVVQAFSTLDGVVQGPGAPDEDPSGGFTHGGWQGDAALDGLIEEWESRTAGLLLGRRTYDIWAGYWGVAPEGQPGFMGELTRTYNRVPKYVASRTLTSLEWKNAHLLGPDVAATAARLRAEPAERVASARGGEPGAEGELRIWGSTELVRTLAAANLIDEYRILTYPLVLGEGTRLFGEGFPLSSLRLAESRPLSSGVVLSVYRPAAPAA